MPRWTVTLEDSLLGDLDSTVAELKSAGMEVEQVLEGLGLVIGTGGEATVEACRRLPGVASVDPEGEMHATGL